MLKSKKALSTARASGDNLIILVVSVLLATVVAFYVINVTTIMLEGSYTLNSLL